MDVTESKLQPVKDQNQSSNKLRNIGIGCLVFFFATSWILMALYVFFDVRARYVNPFSYVSPYQYSRWAVAPDRSQKAILVQDYYFDLNFRLFIVEPYAREIPLDFKQAIWSSRDYEPTPFRDWDDDILWGCDSSVVAVTIENEYVFAYDFNTSKKIDDPETIIKLLEELCQPPPLND
ncbi:MAG: hypothetical protein ABFS17_01740 [Chloroflexota bacterium]